MMTLQKTIRGSPRWSWARLQISLWISPRRIWVFSARASKPLPAATSRVCSRDNPTTTSVRLGSAHSFFLLAMNLVLGDTWLVISSSGISFIPREVGEHLVSIKKNGQHVPNSPITIMVVQSEIGDASRVKVFGQGLVEGNTFEMSDFVVDTREAGERERFDLLFTFNLLLLINLLFFVFFLIFFYLITKIDF